MTLVYLFGIFTLVDGAAAHRLGFRGESDGTVWWTLVLMGVLAVIAGIFVFAFPAIAALWLLALIAATAIVRGMFEIVAAIRLRKELDDEWILALSGVMSILFGGLILYRPDAGLVAIVLADRRVYDCDWRIRRSALSLRLAPDEPYAWRRRREYVGCSTDH